ncbi:MAG: dihydrolipoyl dehydrogenase [Firmicutes bacterium]|nr:dihydrolipoyl dehydrogenase [Bacillota bacterium]
MAEANKTGLAVVGGGPGGYAAAFLAADLGLDVTLIDEQPNPGGVCLYRGCIPSKALLHAAKVITEAREADHFGVQFGEPKIDLDRLRSWKDSVVAKMTSGLGQLSKARKVRYVQGRAALLDAHTLEVRNAQEARKIAFEHAILATGSRPATLPNFDLNSQRVWDSTAALELPWVPKSLLVVGGGYIGLELGQVYAALGTKVTVVEMMPTLLPGVDADLVQPLHKRLEKQFAAIHLNTKVGSAKETKSGIQVRFEGEGAGKEQTFEAVLVAVGRKPNSEVPGLENTRVKKTSRGYIEVDPQRRTAEPSLFAIGDVAGEPMLAHKASHEGRLAVEVIRGSKAQFEPLAIPAVVFTDPEIAWCGLTETQAKEQNRDVKIARFPWAASGRATTLNRSDGVTKLVLDAETEQILGVGLAGPSAGELIAEGVLAVEMGALAKDLALCIHPHPTLSETLMEAAEALYGTSTHIYRPKK